jgi:hypothetical protein
MTGTGNFHPERDSRNRFALSPAAQDKARRAIALRVDEGLTYGAIAEALDYADRKTAYNAIWRQLRREAKGPVEALIKAESERLFVELERLDTEEERIDALIEPVTRVLNTRHITVSNGRVILHPATAEPLEDDAPVLQAVDRLTRLSAERRAISEQRRRISESLRKLHGLDAPTRVDATVHETTQQDLELQEMLREAKAKVTAEEQALRDGEG